jgi:hypothetical protein
MSFRDEFLRLRQAADLTQEEAAERLQPAGISATIRTIRNWEAEREDRRTAPREGDQLLITFTVRIDL